MALMQANLGSGWFDIPQPKPEGYYPHYTHLEKSYNDDLGNLHRDFVWKNRAKIECAWNELSASQLSLLQDLYDAEEFSMKFYDNKGRLVQKIMYAGQPKGQVYSKNKYTGIPEIWVNVTQNYIEKRR